jgi:hypothetical protein
VLSSLTVIVSIISSQQVNSSNCLQLQVTPIHPAYLRSGGQSELFPMPAVPLLLKTHIHGIILWYSKYPPLTILVQYVHVYIATKHMYVYDRQLLQCRHFPFSIGARRAPFKTG